METEEVVIMRNSATLAIHGEKLPPELSAALDGGEAGAVYAVHVRKLPPEEAAAFIEIRAKVQEGIADIEAGNLVDADEVHARLEQKFGIVIRR
ncbi:MAG: hypothetical protein HQL40_01830 [Alphaproteobacteria bacterium]|nr:hypothetical protein [Alphaproteobacteria bacterium]